MTTKKRFNIRLKYNAKLPLVWDYRRDAHTIIAVLGSYRKMHINFVDLQLYFTQISVSSVSEGHYKLRNKHVFIDEDQGAIRSPFRLSSFSVIRRTGNI